MKFQPALLILVLAGAADAHAGAIVTTRDSGLPTMDAKAARGIFLGRELGLNGQPIAVVYQGEGRTRTDFETKVLGKTGSELTAYRSKMIFTGKAPPPLEAVSDEGVKATLSHKTYAVGYISDNAIDDSVKVLFRF